MSLALPTMPHAVTDGISVTVEAFYLKEHSAPEEQQYVFAYEVEIANEGESAAQLVSRHWVITDSAGGVEEVRGAGVVGETPHIPPGQVHVYQSFCVLRTPRGTMHGSYQMVRDNGETFDAEIPTFVLRAPSKASDQVLH